MRKKLNERKENSRFVAQQGDSALSHHSASFTGCPLALKFRYQFRELSLSPAIYPKLQLAVNDEHGASPHFDARFLSSIVVGCTLHHGSGRLNMLDPLLVHPSLAYKPRQLFI